MDAAFPFGFPPATAFYLFWFVLTLGIHVGFMNYVLAGTAYVAAWAWRPAAARPAGYAVAKDWLPLMLSGAITAGVAPLLFVQILYQQNFYTANLLLFNRWMSILPVLILGFYAMYLGKSGWAHRRPLRVFAAVSTVPFLAAAYVAISWTENHLLSVRPVSEWAAFYATRAQLYHEPQLIPRLCVWAFGSLPTFAVILGWQLWYKQRGDPAVKAAARGVAKLSLGGLALTGCGAAAYAAVAGEAVRAAFVGTMGMLYFVVAAAGLAMQAVAWAGTLRAGHFCNKRLSVATAGLVLTIAGMTVCRECVRLDTLGAERVAALYPRHAAMADVSGFGWFLLFFVANAALIVWVFRLARNAQQQNMPNKT